MGHRNRVLTDKQVVEMCQRYQAGESMAAMAKDYNVVPQSLSSLLKRRGITKPVTPPASTEWHSDIAQCAYFAGLLDGEGCIAIYLSKGTRDTRYKCGYSSPSWVRSVKVAATCHAQLDDLMQFTGLGTIRQLPPRPRQKYQYEWAVGSKADIINFLTGIMPYMREKREQARVMLLACQGSYPDKDAAAFLKQAKRGN